jgi:hypothetical protein
MGMSNRMTEELAAIAFILPQSISASVVYSDVIPINALQYGRRFMGILSVGAIGSSASVSGSWYWSATTGGSYVAITGTAITADTAGSDVHVVEVSTEQAIAFAAGVGFIKFGIASATAATYCSFVAIGGQLSQNPPNGLINTKVVEVVTGPVASVG